jgi:UDP-N-acetylglucosamine 4,6-dehydratase
MRLFGLPDKVKGFGCAPWSNVAKTTAASLGKRRTIMQAGLLNDKCVLITGGTGSFGNEVREVRIFSRDELKQETMRRNLNEPRLRFHIGDVRDIGTVDRAMRGVDMVFHAAALKQVPSCEFFPDQALLTNVNGSQNVLDSAA